MLYSNMSGKPLTLKMLEANFVCEPEVDTSMPTCQDSLHGYPRSDAERGRWVRQVSKPEQADETRRAES